MKNNNFNLSKFLKDNLFLIFKLIFKEKQVSLWKKIIPIFGFLYLLSPFDLIPEIFNPILGLTDDTVLIIILLKLFLMLVPKSIINKYRGSNEN